MKIIMNKTMNELQTKINQTEQLITEAKANLKSWANQISHYHKKLKALSQQLEAIKQQINMNENNQLNNNPKGGTN